MYVYECYHYRVHDVVVNFPLIYLPLVEEIYEREIQLEEEYEREKTAEMRVLYIWWSSDPVSSRYGATEEGKDSSQSE